MKLSRVTVSVNELYVLTDVEKVEDTEEEVGESDWGVVATEVVEEVVVYLKIDFTSQMSPIIFLFQSMTNSSSSK